MSLPEFILHQPCTIEDALKCAVENDSAFSFMAGGTDLLPSWKMRLNNKKHLISLSKILSLKELSASKIGAGVKLSELARSDCLLPQILKNTAKLIAGPGLREAATVGGNLLLSGRCVYFNQSELSRCAHGSCMKAEGDACFVVPQKEKCYAVSSGDLGPVLMVLGASVGLVSSAGRREIRLDEFYCPNGISAHVIDDNEILQDIIIPKEASKLKVRYEKLRARSAMDFPEAGVAVAIHEKDGTPTEIRVALGALGPKPFLFAKSLDGLPSSSSEKLANAVWAELKPEVSAVKNASFPPTYRKEMAKLYLKRILDELLFS